jgi:hypothetical protein
VDFAEHDDGLILHYDRVLNPATGRRAGAGVARTPPPRLEMKHVMLGGFR